MFFLLYKIKVSDDGFFDDFPKISDHFPKIFEDFPKLFWRPDERSRTFSENFRKFPKISEEFRRFSKTTEEDPKMFRWYNNLDISEIIDIFTCEDTVSFLLICYHSVYHWLLYNKMVSVWHIDQDIFIYILRWCNIWLGKCRHRSYHLHILHIFQP